jgi:diguanylate cyclase (GGDEF)-like protein
MLSIPARTPSNRTMPARASALAVGGAIVLLGPVLAASGNGNGAAETIRHTLVMVLAGVALLAHARANRAERVLWGALGAAELLTAIGIVLWRWAFDFATLSPADIFFASPYLMFWVAIGALLRRRVGSAATKLWLDVAGTSLALLAIVTALVLPVLIDGGMSAVSGTLNIAYACLAAVLATAPITIATLTGRRIGSQDVLLASGFAALCAGSSLYLMSLAGTTPDTAFWNAAFELLCDLSPLLFVAAIWGRPTGSGSPPIGGWWERLPTLAWMAGGASVLVAGLLTPVEPIASVLAVAALLAAGVRGLVMLRGVRELVLERHEALSDDLTGLPNRRALFRELDVLTRDRGRSGERAALVFLGVDGFRELNDTLGHDGGDALLRALGERFAQVAGDRLLVRLGDDEFAVLVRRDSTEAETLAQQLREAAEQPLELDDVTVAVQVSAGCAQFPQDARDAGELARRADVAMQDAKRRRVGVASYLRAHDDHSRERLAFAGELRDALRRADGGLWLAFQPQLDLRSGRCTGVEALIRWHHPERGVISPAELLPVAERTGQMNALSDWVLTRALATLAELGAAGHELRLAINLSPSTLLDIALPERVSAALEEHGVAPSSLVVEVTEEAVIGDLRRCTDVLAGIRRLGVDVSVDDFGTGQSSLSQLRSLPVDELKIDRSFIGGMEPFTPDAEIVKLIIALGRSLGLRVVGEGVEHASQLRALERLECDCAQGFAIARPMPADELLRHLGAATPIPGD